MEESIEKLKELLDNFKQFMIFTTEGDYQILKGKNDFTVKETKKTREITTLKNVKNMKFTIIGLDLKKDVMDYCNKVARELNCENLEFLTGNIKDFDKMKDADIIFSLHACNNATDYALLKGLELNAKAILAVPCCQHEFNQKMSSNKNSEFFNTENVIGKHGILLEKFTSVATDAFRAQALELCGFKT